MKASPNKNCLATNLCNVGNPEGPSCGTDKEHLIPLPIAEQMCPRALTGRINALKGWIDGKAQPARIAEDYAAAAWLELESAIARPNSSDAPIHADRSKEYADLAMSQPYSRFHGIYSAALLNVYRQSLMKRGEHATAHQNLDATRKGLGAIFDVLQLIPIHAPQVEHILDAIDNDQPHHPCLASEGERQVYEAKLTGMMLAARQDIFLYPASDREANGTSTWAGLNHDAYSIVDGEKKLIKFHNKAKNLAAHRKNSGYDNSIIFVNMRAVVNTTVTQLMQNDRPKYNLLLNIFDGRPDVTKIGKLLAAEAKGEKIHTPQQKFLDLLGSHLGNLLTSEKEASIQPQTIASPEPSRKNFGKIDGWSILPSWVMSLHNESRNMYRPEQAEDAFNAMDSYLKSGHSRPKVGRLQNYINRLHPVPIPKVTAECVSLYIDLARHPEITPGHAVELIEASQTLAQTLKKYNWQELDPASIQRLHYVALQSAYSEKYKKVLSGESPTIDDEAKLYLQLLEVGKDTIEPARRYQPSRGSQFEIALHILNTRFNIRNGQIIQSAWPALTREDEPHTFNRKNDPDGSKLRQYKMTRNTAWDLAVTRGAFLEEGAECRYIQSKSLSDGKKYDPAVTVITCKGDFLLSSTADIINDAIDELTANPSAKEEIRARLNNYEAIFLDKLGF